MQTESGVEEQTNSGVGIQVNPMHRTNGTPNGAPNGTPNQPDVEGAIVVSVSVADDSTAPADVTL